MSKMSMLANQICANPSKPSEGLRQKPNGVYELVKTHNGKQKSFSSKNPEEVWEKYAAYLKHREDEELESENQEATRERGPMFEVVAERYREKVLNMRNGTQRSYLPAIERAIKEFGNRRMKDIEPWQIKDFLNRMGAAKTTVSNQKSVINAIYQLYIDDREWHGDYNPAALTKMPRNLPRSRREPPKPEQITAVKNAAKNPSVDDLIPIVYLCTGGRRGEGCAIQLQNIDWENNIIYIEKAVEWPHNQPKITQTKTDAGIRRLPLLKLMRDALEPYRTLPPETYIIGMGSKPVTQSQYERAWARFWRDHGFAHPIVREYKREKGGKVYQYRQTDWKADICAHQFRHEYVCMLCEANVKEEIAIQIVGHANAQMVHEVYMHLRPSMLQEAGRLMDDYMAAEK